MSNHDEKDLNRDPLTGEIGSHPIGTGIGASLGGSSAALVGAVLGGPIGAVVGMVAGSVIGGMTGKATAELLDPTVEEAYWHDNFQKENYYVNGKNFDDYSTAYGLGYDGRQHFKDKSWEDSEAELAAAWNTAKGNSSLTWDQARPAVRASWNRLDNHFKNRL